MKGLIPFLISFLILIGCEVPSVGEEDLIEIKNEQEQDQEENDQEEENEEE